MPILQQLSLLRLFLRYQHVSRNWNLCAGPPVCLLQCTYAVLNTFVHDADRIFNAHAPIVVDLKNSDSADRMHLFLSRVCYHTESAHAYSKSLPSSPGPTTMVIIRLGSSRPSRAPPIPIQFEALLEVPTWTLRAVCVVLLYRKSYHLMSWSTHFACSRQLG